MRTFDRVLSVLLALLLVTLGVLIPVEVVRGLAGADPLLPYSQVADFFRERSWSSGLIITISAIVAGLGLLLVLAELKRRRPTQIILSTDSEEVTVDISRRSLARAVANAATSTDRYGWPPPPRYGIPARWRNKPGSEPRPRWSRWRRSIPCRCASA